MSLSVEKIGFQLVGTFLFCVNFLLLDAPVGAILNAVAVVRAIVFLKIRADHILWLSGFCGGYVAAYAVTFIPLNKEPTLINLVIELLPIIGMVATTISFRFSDAKAIRRFGLISSLRWRIYNIASFSVGAIICEVISLAYIILGIYRFDRRKNNGYCIFCRRLLLVYHPGLPGAARCLQCGQRLLRR